MSTRLVTPHLLPSLLGELGLPEIASGVDARAALTLRSPVDGAVLGALAAHASGDVAAMVARAQRAYRQWRLVPAPRRGELVRLLGDELRRVKSALGQLVSLEAGKILSEGQGEVQEMIDICDFAVGLSRQLYGLTIASERPGHRMLESWHPLGVVGVISAFNFPAAVWSWNFAVALVCGNAVIWKPSEKTPLVASACQAAFVRACQRWAAVGELPPTELSQLLLGDREVGAALADHPDVALVSATGSTRMGRALAPRVAQRFGRLLLELGGNNAVIVAPSADLELAARAVLFSAVGTAGQRCTTTRRLIVHETVADALLARLQQLYARLPVGNPLQADTLVGPLIDANAFAGQQAALQRALTEGGQVLGVGGARVAAGGWDDAYYVQPALVAMPEQTPVVCEETFAPILYVLRYRDWEQALQWHNAVPQGLSSALFTDSVREAEAFLGPAGSDCGIANINIGTSGAEIGGAFGGEKETGGGRESGSDAWKTYMRRATNTINGSDQLPLAQGVRFEL